MKFSNSHINEEAKNKENSEGYESISENNKHSNNDSSKGENDLENREADINKKRLIW